MIKYQIIVNICSISDHVLLNNENSICVSVHKSNILSIINYKLVYEMSFTKSIKEETNYWKGWELVIVTFKTFNFNFGRI